MLTVLFEFSGSTHKRPMIPVSLIFGILCNINIIHATIPAGALTDPRYALGYLVVTYYTGVNPGGTGDSRAGIQEALYDAYDNNLVVFFPSGTYQVSDVLKCYYWSFWNSGTGSAYNPPTTVFAMLGSSLGSSRPVIKLAANAPGFDNPLNPRPVIVWRYFSATNLNGNTRVEPSDPLTGVPANFMDQPNVIFGWEVRNIDIDVNNHAGAIGACFTSAQWSAVTDMRVNATGGYCGICGVPGRNSYLANIEVEGGKYGILNKGGGSAGSCLVGARLYHQTEYAITSEDFCPWSVVGLDIITNAQKSVYIGTMSWWSTANGTMTLVDCKIEMLNGGIAIDNTSGKNIHISNVFIKGTTSLIQSGTEAPVGGSADWKQVIEYTYNDQTIASGTKYFTTYSVINGVKSRIKEPSTRLGNSEPAPDLITRHNWRSLPSYEGENDGTINVKSAPYNAKGDGVTNDFAAIQAAIDASPNGKVFLPKGNYVISQPLMLNINTILVGANQTYTKLLSTASWAGGSASYMINTVNKSDATTFFGFIGFEDQATSAANITAGFINWRAGRNSMIMSCMHSKKWGSYYGLQARYNYKFSGNAGGRHFFNPHQEEGASNADSRQVFIEGTTQPLTFYGLNVECTKTRTTNPNIATLGSNVEIVNSSNIRFHSMKREGRSPSIIIRNSHNIGFYGMGRLNADISPGLGGYIQIIGNCSDIVFATIVVDSKTGTGTFPTLSEAITGQTPIQVDWPDYVSIYKRGELSDIYTAETSVNKVNSSGKLSSLISCSPNPFRNEISIKFAISAFLKMTLGVYNSQGQEIKILTDKMFPEGEHQVIWDAKDDTGHPVPSGLYFVKMIAENNVETGKIILLNH